mgnify:CR=1 FL=1
MEKTPISRNQVLALLADGKTREEIRLQLGLTKRDANLLFKDAALTGKRTKVAPSFVLVDDETPESVAETPVSTTVATTQQESVIPVVNTTDTPTASPVVMREEETII